MGSAPGNASGGWPCRSPEARCWPPGVSFALAIGELPAAYMVRAPGRDPLSIYVWSLLHMGVESRLAGVGLILLAVVAVVGLGASWALRRALRLDSPKPRPIR